MSNIQKGEKPEQLRNQSFDNGSEFNFYETLQITSDASPLQIREAYIRLKNTYSQGNQALYSLLSEQDAQESLAQLEQAYRVLYDDHQRRDYDQSLLYQKSKLGQNSADPFSAGHTASSDMSFQGLAEEKPEPRKSQESMPQHEAKKFTESAQVMRFAPNAQAENIKEKVDDLVNQTDVIDGEFLVKLRELQGVSQKGLQDKTKVSLQYIICMEKNDFHGLPSHVYVRGFLKICLQYLGVGSRVSELAERYLEFMNHCTEKAAS